MRCRNCYEIIVPRVDDTVGWIHRRANGTMSVACDTIHGLTTEAQPCMRCVYCNEEIVTSADELWHLDARSGEFSSLTRECASVRHVATSSTQCMNCAFSVIRDIRGSWIHERINVCPLPYIDVIPRNVASAPVGTFSVRSPRSVPSNSIHQAVDRAYNESMQRNGAYPGSRRILTALHDARFAARRMNAPQDILDNLNERIQMAEGAEIRRREALQSRPSPWVYPNGLSQPAPRVRLVPQAVEPRAAESDVIELVLIAISRLSVDRPDLEERCIEFAQGAENVGLGEDFIYKYNAMREEYIGNTPQEDKPIRRIRS